MTPEQEQEERNRRWLSDYQLWLQRLGEEVQAAEDAGHRADEERRRISYSAESMVAQSATLNDVLRWKGWGLVTPIEFEKYACAWRTLAPRFGEMHERHEGHDWKSCPIVTRMLAEDA